MDTDPGQGPQSRTLDTEPRTLTPDADPDMGPGPGHGLQTQAPDTDPLLIPRSVLAL